MTWEIKGLPKELEQRVTSELPSNSWKLTLSLPLSQPNGSLTCVVSNQVDQKTATLDLGEVCVSGECTCQRGGALRELGALGFSPHHVISTTFLPGHPFQEPGRYTQLMSALTVSEVHACLSTPFSPQEKRNLFLMQIKLVHLQMSNSQFQLALETEQVWCGGGQESWGCSSKSNP